MNKLKLVAFLLVLSASLAGCYTKFTAAEADRGRPEDDRYSESYTYYAPPDSLFSGQTTIINNYYGPYSRFFTPSWGWYYDPYWYDPYWSYYWRPSSYYWGIGFYYGGWYPWYYDYYYPWHPHHYNPGGGSPDNQMPRTSGRLRSSYRSSKSPQTMPDVRPATIPWNTSTRPVRTQTAPQTTGDNQSQEAVRRSGSGEKQTKSEQRPSVRTRSTQRPSTQERDRSNDNRDSQRTNNPGSDSNNRPENRREEPRSYSPPSQPSEPRGGGGSRESGGDRGSGNTSTRQR